MSSVLAPRLEGWLYDPREMTEVSLLGDVRDAADELGRRQEGVDVARAKLYDTIVTAHDEGIPLSKIAEAAKLSRQRIAQIVDEAHGE